MDPALSTLGSIWGKILLSILGRKQVRERTGRETGGQKDGQKEQGKGKRKEMRRGNRRRGNGPEPLWGKSDAPDPQIIVGFERILLAPLVTDQL